jgi:hypothetical protein
MLRQIATPSPSLIGKIKNFFVQAASKTMSVVASRVEKRRSNCSLPVAIGRAFTPPPQSGLT